MLWNRWTKRAVNCHKHVQCTYHSWKRFVFSLRTVYIWVKKFYSRVLKLNQHKCLYVIPLLQHNITLNKDRKMWNSVAFCLSTCRKLGRKLMYLHKISIMHFLYISTTNHNLVCIWKYLRITDCIKSIMTVINQELLYSSPWINGL